MSPQAYLTRRTTFSAAHRLHSLSLDAAENAEVFGKCNHVHGHGHNYSVEVTVRGPVDPVTGMVMNLTDLKVVMDKCIMDPLDHKNIDKDVSFFQQRVSTSENVAIFIWQGVQEALRTRHKAVKLHEVKLWETDKNIVVYRGEFEHCEDK